MMTKTEKIDSNEFIANWTPLSNTQGLTDGGQGKEIVLAGMVKVNGSAPCKRQEDPPGRRQEATDGAFEAVAEEE